jgi:hypothetical protein
MGHNALALLLEHDYNANQFFILFLRVNLVPSRVFRAPCRNIEFVWGSATNARVTASFNSEMKIDSQDN